MVSKQASDAEADGICTKKDKSKGTLFPSVWYIFNSQKTVSGLLASDLKLSRSVNQADTLFCFLYC